MPFGTASLIREKTNCASFSSEDLTAGPALARYSRSNATRSSSNTFKSQTSTDSLITNIHDLLKFLA